MDLDLSKLPKFVYIFVVTLVVAIVYWIFIGRVLVENAPTMIQEHQDNVALITKYDNALKQEKVIEAEIEKNTQEYDKRQAEMFIDLKTCSKELEQELKSRNIKLKTYSIAEPQLDTMGRVSSGGYQVYTVNIALAFNDTYDKTLDILKYVETQSKGCYNVNSVNFVPSQTDKNKGDVTISMTLYYYDTTQVVEMATEAPTTSK